MDINDRLLIEQACRSLVNRLTWLVDHHHDAEATALFAKDATWLRGGRLYAGHDEILSSFAGTQALVIRHYVSTITVDVMDASSARAVTYYTLFKCPDGTDPGKLPMPIPPVFSMGEWNDEFRLDRGEWRFSSRVVDRLFQAA